jgi:exodeoxyribonuclease VII small subunit
VAKKNTKSSPSADPQTDPQSDLSNETNSPRGTESSYEELIEQLEFIVDRIESGDVGLEESIKGYEEGIGLVNRARKILDQAEQRIVELNDDQSDNE